MDPYGLSSDLMFEILSRVPLKTLTTCRLLSKELNSLTYESTFMRSNCQRTSTIAGYYVQSSKYSRYHQTFLSIDNPYMDRLSLDFLPEPVQILATVDQGLMFCVNQGLQNHHYICKPSTRQWETIPNPNPISFTIKIGMVVLGSEPLRFKIVRLSEVQNKYSKLELEDSDESESDYDYDYDYKHYKCEIFDTNGWDWKQLEDVDLSYDVFFDSKPAVSAYAGLHWLTWNRNGDKNNLLSFYEESERWELVSLPEPLCDWKFVHLAKYEGKLAVICVTPEFDFGELWILKDFYGEKQWSQEHTVPLKKDIDHSLFGFYNADIILLKRFYSAIFYNFKNGGFECLELDCKHKYPQSSFFIRTDYEPINLRKSRRISPSTIVPVPAPNNFVYVLFSLFLF